MILYYIAIRMFTMPCMCAGRVSYWACAIWCQHCSVLSGPHAFHIHTASAACPDACSQLVSAIADMPHCRSLRRGSQRHRAEHALVNLSQRPAWIQHCCTAKADFAIIHYECLLRCHSPRWSLKADIQACTQKPITLEALSPRLPVLAGMLCSKAILCLCLADGIKRLEVQLP